jgi:CubicO group peptidase (beta-lactamase class C family)
MSLRNLLFSFILLTCCVASPAQTAAPAAAVKVSVTDVDADVARAMRLFHPPGVAVGILTDGKVVMAKGYGVRKVGTTQAVDADTLFDIGSITKSFTGVAVAAMVDDGKLKFDTPVTQYLPTFRMYDPIATQLITVRDMLGHRTGLPRHDWIRFSTYLSPDAFVERIRYLPPNHTFRETFQYNNLMYSVAGYLAGRVNGTSWEDLYRQRIFAPLGMTETNISAAEMKLAPNVAWPHVLHGRRAEEIPLYDYQSFGIGANGAVNSSVTDMLKYIEFQLGTDGSFHGKAVLSATQFNQTHRAISADGNLSYAMGWIIDHRGAYRVLLHDGSIDGYTAQIALVPDLHMGIIVLNNAETALPGAVVNNYLNRVLGVAGQEDAIDRAVRLEAVSNKRHDEAVKTFEAGRLPNAPPTIPLTAYVGTWFHPAFGPVRVTVAGDGLDIAFDAKTLHLSHYNYDTFAMNGTQIATMHLDPAGRPSEMLLPLEPNVTPFIFVPRR